MPSYLHVNAYMYVHLSFGRSRICYGSHERATPEDNFYAIIGRINNIFVAYLQIRNLELLKCLSI